MDCAMVLELKSSPTLPNMKVNGAKANGKGKFFHVTGDVYDGDWKDDTANGFGKYSHANCAEYIGDWKNDL